jgi:hypothetical protein
MRQALPFPRIGGGIMSGQYGREAQVWSGDFSRSTKYRQPPPELNWRPAAVYGSISGSPLMRGATMCYSRYWQTDDERRQRDAKAQEAEAKRRETVKTMLADAEKQAHAKASKVRASAPAK